MTILILIYAGCVTAIVAYFANSLALRPWRRAKAEHWSERARLFQPVRGAASVNLWVLPAIMTMGVQLLWDDEAPHWALVALTSAIGAVLGTIPMDREVFPRISNPDLIRQCVGGWIVRFLMWGVFLGAIALMPAEFNLQSLLLTIIVVSLLIWWSHDGWISVGRRIRMFAPPPERLRRIVSDIAAQMNIPYRDVWLLRSSFAQAFAMPATRRLLISERLLEILTDEEVSVVCAHELAHLTEKKSDYLLRYLGWLMFLPWIFLTPALHYLGLGGFFVLLFTSVLVPKLVNRISHRLELRADAMAQANEPDPGVYARALIRLHEDSLVPAVNSKQRATHPHLYDRLIAAGVTPDFPRPAPAKDLAPHGSFFAGALGLLAVVIVGRILDLL